jgi:hypothetical protein
MVIFGLHANLWATPHYPWYIHNSWWPNIFWTIHSVTARAGLNTFAAHIHITRLVDRNRIICCINPWIQGVTNFGCLLQTLLWTNVTASSSLLLVFSCIYVMSFSIFMAGEGEKLYDRYLLYNFLIDKPHLSFCSCRIDVKTILVLRGRIEMYCGQRKSVIENQAQ